MTAPVAGQSAGPETGQSAVPGTTDPSTAANAGGQSAPGAPVTPPETGQSAVTREEFDRLRQQLAAADQKRNEAENQLRQIRDKDMPALEKAQRDLAEVQQASAAKDAIISSLQVENAFFKDNTHDWHSAQAALQLLDRARITVDSDGKVAGMKDALEALAKAHPYLLKPKAPEGQTPAAPPPPGTTPTNGGITPQTGGKMSKEQMARDFPALRQRLG